ncbi:hypothetical protein ACRALDRAFT_2015797 [Sodiomyces alcalophilus JCM 7366]|uniref:uncharacterized protein n=1 Tax=Sodiomyces alcalophilus JCM 7366 TaxID=591952 RepID=UPI0039B37DA5
MAFSKSGIEEEGREEARSASLEAADVDVFLSSLAHAGGRERARRAGRALKVRVCMTKLRTF